MRACAKTAKLIRTATKFLSKRTTKSGFHSSSQREQEDFVNRNLGSLIHSLARPATADLRRACISGFLLILVAIPSVYGFAQDVDPLPSWHKGPTKDSIVQFVQRVTNENGPDFVQPNERIATFDNDGTLWSEKPFYFQLAFAMDRVKELANDHPEWKTIQPFQGVLENDLDAVLATGKKGLIQLVMATHSGMTTDEFETIAMNWLNNSRHPRWNRPYTECVYQPMLELLDYLRANDFKTYIVSAGGVEFMRPWTEKVYGIPREQVIGSSIATKFDLRDGAPVLWRLPEIDFVDDGPAKPVAIHKFINRRPIASFGNSDGDLEMLQWTAAGKGPRFCLLVHHTDAKREWAYDRDSAVGRLDEALVEAKRGGWTVVDMKRDWKKIYPPEKK